MRWDYRVVRKDDGYAVHEVYYEDGEPVMVTERAISPYGDTEKELWDDMLAYQAAIARPVLDYDDIPGDYAGSFVAQE